MQRDRDREEVEGEIKKKKDWVENLKVKQHKVTEILQQLNMELSEFLIPSSERCDIFMLPTLDKCICIVGKTIAHFFLIYPVSYGITYLQFQCFFCLTIIIDRQSDYL